jgi:DeoR family transcriptional regulator, catabolite repression regulator
MNKGMRVVVPIKLTQRQEEILQIVRLHGPIPGQQIADKLSLARATLRPDLAILTMTGNLEARPRVGYIYNKASNLQQSASELINQPVSKYKAHPIVIQKSRSVYDAIVTLFLEDVGTLYVVNNEGHLAGVVSRKDLLRASLGSKNLEDLPVNVIMTRMPNIITLRQEETLSDAAKKMNDFHIDSLPVVQEIEPNSHTYHVIGRVTKTTITRAFLEMIES